MDGLIAVDLHGEVFGEEHLSVGGEGDGEAEEKQEGEASQGLKGWVGVRMMRCMS